MHISRRSSTTQNMKNLRHYTSDASIAPMSEPSTVPMLVSLLVGKLKVHMGGGI